MQLDDARSNQKRTEHVIIGQHARNITMHGAIIIGQHARNIKLCSVQLLLSNMLGT